MSFMQFDNFEQMAKWMDDRTKEANLGLAPEQVAISYGHTWARFDQLDTGIGIVFGRIFTEAEYLAGELDDEVETPSETLARIRENHDRGYMYGIAYSMVEPDGEYGDTHRANMWPIDGDLFAAAAEAGWDHRALPIGDQINLSIAFEAWRTHELGLIAEARAKLAEERDAL
jgi:hypothetical protein